MLDSSLEEILADPRLRKAEALTWLQESKGRGTLGSLSTTEESIALVQEAYEMGAEEVLALQIDEYTSGMENAGKLLVVLPGKPGERAAVFDWCAAQAEERGYDIEEDSGQTHLFVLLD